MKKIFFLGHLVIFISLIFTPNLFAADPEIIIPNQPQYLFEGDTIYFEVININSNRLKWEFSDGSEEIGGKKIGHVFRSRGFFNISVQDLEGNFTGLIRKQVNIVGDTREIVVTGQHFYPGTPVKMEAKNFLDWSVQWDFGDGTIQKLGARISHTYQRGGSYTIKAWDYGGRGERFFSKEIRINEDNRAIIVPKEILAGESAELQIKNAGSGDYSWEFSDGQRAAGPAVKTNPFKNPGPVTITVNDRTGQLPPLTLQLMVMPDNRRLNSKTGFVLPEETAAFEAEQFRGPAVTWDFGDGTIKNNGSKKESHTYKQPGTYKVTARDFNGQSPKTFTTTVMVNEITPDFRLNYLEMAFANGKSYQVASLKNRPPSYYVKMRAVGRGILKGQWVLDGQIIGLFEVMIHQNKPADLSGDSVIALPMKDLGIHTLTLAFTNYNFPQRPPFIRYFVMEADAIRIVSPGPDAKVPTPPQGTLQLKWQWTDSSSQKWAPGYQVSLSKVPALFLSDEQMTWIDVGKKNHYTLDLAAFQDKKGDWVYWQVRGLKPNGDVFTISDIASFKLVEK